MKYVSLAVSRLAKPIYCRAQKLRRGGGGGGGDDTNEAQVGFACVRRNVEPRNAQLHTPDVFSLYFQLLLMTTHEVSKES
jgi:hypothetical protein